MPPIETEGPPTHSKVRCRNHAFLSTCKSHNSSPWPPLLAIFPITRPDLHDAGEVVDAAFIVK